jgi:hypothetical protein
MKMTPRKSYQSWIKKHNSKHCDAMEALTCQPSSLWIKKQAYIKLIRRRWPELQQNRQFKIVRHAHSKKIAVNAHHRWADRATPSDYIYTDRVSKTGQEVAALINNSVLTDSWQCHPLDTRKRGIEEGGCYQNWMGEKLF